MDVTRFVGKTARVLLCTMLAVMNGESTLFSYEAIPGSEDAMQTTYDFMEEAEDFYYDETLEFEDPDYPLLPADNGDEDEYDFMEETEDFYYDETLEFEDPDDPFLSEAEDDEAYVIAGEEEGIAFVQAESVPDDGAFDEEYMDDDGAFEEETDLSGFETVEYADEDGYTGTQIIEYDSEGNIVSVHVMISKDETVPDDINPAISVRTVISEEFAYTVDHNGEKTYDWGYKTELVISLWNEHTDSFSMEMTRYERKEYEMSATGGWVLMEDEEDFTEAAVQIFNDGSPQADLPLSKSIKQRTFRYEVVDGARTDRKEGTELVSETTWGKHPLTGAVEIIFSRYDELTYTGYSEPESIESYTRTTEYRTVEFDDGNDNRLIRESRHSYGMTTNTFDALGDVTGTTKDMSKNDVEWDITKNRPRYLMSSQWHRDVEGTGYKVRNTTNYELFSGKLKSEGFLVEKIENASDVGAGIGPFYERTHYYDHNGSLARITVDRGVYANYSIMYSPDEFRIWEWNASDGIVLGASSDIEETLQQDEWTLLAAFPGLFEMTPMEWPSDILQLEFPEEDESYTDDGIMNP